MKTRIEKAYRFYKSQYPSQIAMFRIGDKCSAYLEDAEKLQAVFGGSGSSFSVPADTVYDFIRECSTKNLAVRLVSCRNHDGEFDVPDVETIENERNAYY